MRRSQKLYRRLEQLEAELYDVLRRHLEKEATGERSMYLLRQLGFDGWTSKTRCDDETDSAERLEKEVLELRRKVGEPSAEGPLAIIEKYKQLHGAKELLLLDKRGIGRGLAPRGIANRLLMSDLWPTKRTDKENR